MAYADYEQLMTMTEELPTIANLGVGLKVLVGKLNILVPDKVFGRVLPSRHLQGRTLFESSTDVRELGVYSDQVHCCTGQLESLYGDGCGRISSAASDVWKEPQGTH